MPASEAWASTGSTPAGPTVPGAYTTAQSSSCPEPLSEMVLALTPRLLTDTHPYPSFSPMWDQSLSFFPVQ